MVSSFLGKLASAISGIAVFLETDMFSFTLMQSKRHWCRVRDWNVWRFADQFQMAEEGGGNHIQHLVLGVSVRCLLQQELRMFLAPLTSLSVNKILPGPSQCKASCSYYSHSLIWLTTKAHQGKSPETVHFLLEKTRGFVFPFPHQNWRHPL